MVKPKLFLSSLGIINALGNSKAEVLRNFGSQTGIVTRSDLLLGGKILVGAVDVELPIIDKHLANFNCRNNRLLLAAYQQISSEIQQLITQFGKERIAVNYQRAKKHSQRRCWEREKGVKLSVNYFCKLSIFPLILITFLTC